MVHAVLVVRTMRDNLQHHYCAMCGCDRRAALSVWTWALSTVIGILGGAVIAAVIAWALLAAGLPW